MSKVAVIGECMIEYQDYKSKYKQSFGGDTFNCSVYLKRTSKKIDVEYITVVGEDTLSKKMIDFMHEQDIKTTYVDKISDKNPGLYVISFENKKRSISTKRFKVFSGNSNLCNERVGYSLIMNHL